MRVYEPLPRVARIRSGLKFGSKMNRDNFQSDARDHDLDRNWVN